MFYPQYDLRKMYWHHFLINVVPDKPVVFHDCPQVHKYDKAHRVFYLAFYLPLVHTAVHPCHVSTGIHIDQHSIALDLPNGKSLPVFAHYALRIEDKFARVLLTIFLHRQCRTNRCELYA